MTIIRPTDDRDSARRTIPIQPSSPISWVHRYAGRLVWHKSVTERTAGTTSIPSSFTRGAGRLERLVMSIVRSVFLRVGVAATLLVTGVLPMLSQSANAAPSYSNGDCWRAGTPWWCRTTWRQGFLLPIYVVDNFSDQRPQWGPALDYAINQWNSVPGPQRVSRQRNEYEAGSTLKTPQHIKMTSDRVSWGSHGSVTIMASASTIPGR